MYRVTYWNARIDAIQIMKETDKTVVIARNGCREQKATEHHSWFESHQEAYKHLSDHAEQKIIDANRAMKAAQEYAEQIAKLVPSK